MPKRRIFEDGTEINTTPILVPEIGLPTKPVPELSPESTSDSESVSGSEGSVPEPPGVIADFEYNFISTGSLSHSD